MADEQRERMESFRAFINAVEEGASIPPVAEDDLRRLHKVSADMAQRRVGKEGMVSVGLMARVCSPGANLPAVWLRYNQLSLLIRQGVLAECQHRAGWVDDVCRTAAIIPMSGLQLDQKAFVQHLHHSEAAA
jgi:hypothetical protein